MNHSLEKDMQLCSNEVPGVMYGLAQGLKLLFCDI